PDRVPISASNEAPSRGGSIYQKSGIKGSGAEKNAAAKQRDAKFAVICPLIARHNLESTPETQNRAVRAPFPAATVSSNGDIGETAALSR
ncbi:MAG: hypothetical protein LBD68_04285, partial [Zoogloeaceae bacterium]|nr:hypothetical protein [Zoogloeaceae bacterium]